MNDKRGFVVTDGRFVVFLSLSNRLLLHSFGPTGPVQAAA